MRRKSEAQTHQAKALRSEEGRQPPSNDAKRIRGVVVGVEGSPGFEAGKRPSVTPGDESGARHGAAGDAENVNDVFGLGAPGADGRWGPLGPASDERWNGRAPGTDKAALRGMHVGVQGAPRAERENGKEKRQKSLDELANVGPRARCHRHRAEGWPDLMDACGCAALRGPCVAMSQASTGGGNETRRWVCRQEGKSQDLSTWKRTQTWERPAMGI